ncbi:hypothetical protein JYU34_011670 [Plutella xylostella]|uniref:Rad21/Rec8-like protein N-terminal domain-containing protein n=1 Tax=Plutella xylostella TaxID=51655 RepID=A0ABQ7QDB2_PLUXY|nr:hypothetical protein JYU34_011670 [Plutella xylostella]
MFYDKKLMNSASVGPAWRRANGFSCDENGEGKKTLPEVCDKVHRWMKSEDELASRRLSLRAAATLVAGTARLYRHKMNSLLEDLQDLQYQKRFDFKELGSGTDFPSMTEDSSSSKSVASPEEMRQSEKSHILQIDTRKRHFQPISPGHFEIIKKFICSEGDDESELERNDDENDVFNANIDVDDVDSDGEVANHNSGNYQHEPIVNYSVNSSSRTNSDDSEENCNIEVNKNLDKDDDDDDDDEGLEIERESLSHVVSEHIIETGHVTEDSFTPRSNEILNRRTLNSKGTQTDQNESLEPESSHNDEETERNDINNDNLHPNVNLDRVSNSGTPYGCFLIYTEGNQIPTHVIVGDINTNFITMLSSKGSDQ